MQPQRTNTKNIPYLADFLLPLPKDRFLTCLMYKAMYSSCGRDFECQLGNLFHKAYRFLQTNLLKYLSLYKSYWLWDFLPLVYSPVQSKNPSPIQERFCSKTHSFNLDLRAIILNTLTEVKTFLIYTSTNEIRIKL